MSEDTRINRLIEVFEQAAIHYCDACEKHDYDAQGKLVKICSGAAKELDTIGARAALTRLLDHDYLGVRLAAATYLYNIMPERAVAVLKQVHELAVGSACFNSMFILTLIEHGHPLP
jgi:hypothetical protein